MAIKRRRVPRLGKQAKPGNNARKVMTARADAHAAKLAPTIKKLRARGATLRAIAAELNALGIPTPRGRGRWQAPQVARVLARM
jgi:Recombinase